MSQLDPKSSPLAVRPEILQSHFEGLLGIVKRIAPLRVCLFEHVYRGVYSDGWTVVFGRHRMRVRFDCTTKGMAVQKAEAPPSEWYPDWQYVKAENVDWPERWSNAFEAMEKILHDTFAV